MVPILSKLPTLAVIIIIVLLILFVLSILFSIDNFRTVIIKAPVIKNALFNITMKRNQWIHNKIFKMLPKLPAKIMNLGCGLNTYSKFLKDLNYEVIAVDTNDVSIINDKVIIYDGKNLPTCDYDVCILSTVLHHIPMKNHDDIMKMLSKCCKKLIVIEDDLDFFWTPIICMITNIQFYNHPQAFRNYKDWIKFFEKYCYILNSNTDKKHCVFHLQFK